MSETEVTAFLKQLRSTFSQLQVRVLSRGSHPLMHPSLLLSLAISHVYHSPTTRYPITCVRACVSMSTTRRYPRCLFISRIGSPGSDDRCHGRSRTGWRFGARAVL